MHVLATFAVYEHITEMMAEAERDRRVKAAKAANPKPSLRARVASRLSGRGPAQAPAPTAIPNC